MKTLIKALLVVLFGVEALFATGCANTARGVSKDYHNAEDHVERAVK
jgi:predicted small secreted protein